MEGKDAQRYAPRRRRQDREPVASPPSTTRGCGPKRKHVNSTKLCQPVAVLEKRVATHWAGHKSGSRSGSLKSPKW